MDGTPPPIRVLLIDPNKEDRAYWAERLTRFSEAFTVIEADNGAAGLAICQTERIDCVVLELTLPDMSGFQVLTRLNPRAYHPKVPVILFSQRDLPQLKRMAMTNGAQTYFVKSALTGDGLSLAIQRAIAAIATLNLAHPSIHLQGRH